MTTASTNKLALLYLMKILLEETDEHHPLNASALSDRLEKLGYTIDRRSIYADVETLSTFGIDVNRQPGRGGGYYIASRRFELPELKLLVDAVQCAKFITVRKTDALIDKISSLTSLSQAKELRREVWIRNRIKAGNERIYYSVDTVYEAIHGNCQITCQYAEWTMEKKLVPKKNGALYHLSPWAMTWDDENYYLIAYDGDAHRIKHYRVDKMLRIALTDRPREGVEAFRTFDLAIFAKKTFGMYGGTDQRVTLRCANRLTGVILDRFGTDRMLLPDGPDHFRTTVEVAVSPQFFGWVTGIGPDLTVEGPAEVRAGYRDYLVGLLEAYGS